MFNIIADTREQQPWEFSSEKIDQVISRKLDTGDYTVEGLEDKLCIERKKSVAELAGNVTDDRFERELERMSEFPHAFLLLEFGIDDIMVYPKGSRIPKHLARKIRVKGPFIMKRLAEMQIQHNVHIVFGGDTDNARYMATSIMKRVSEKYGQ